MDERAREKRRIYIYGQIKRVGEREREREKVKCNTNLC